MIIAIAQMGNVGSSNRENFSFLIYKLVNHKTP